MTARSRATLAQPRAKRASSSYIVLHTFGFRQQVGYFLDLQLKGEQHHSNLPVSSSPSVSQPPATHTPHTGQLHCLTGSLTSSALVMIYVMKTPSCREVRQVEPKLRTHTLQDGVPAVVPGSARSPKKIAAHPPVRCNSERSMLLQQGIFPGAVQDVAPSNLIAMEKEDFTAENLNQRCQAPVYCKASGGAAAARVAGIHTSVGHVANKISWGVNVLQNSKVSQRLSLLAFHGRDDALQPRLAIKRVFCQPSTRLREKTRSCCWLLVVCHIELISKAWTAWTVILDLSQC